MKWYCSLVYVCVYMYMYTSLLEFHIDTNPLIEIIIKKKNIKLSDLRVVDQIVKTALALPVIYKR